MVHTAVDRRQGAADLLRQPSTKQTYQIYVGDKFDKSTIKRWRGNLAIAPIEFGAGGFFAEWLTVGEVTGKVLTVTVDFSAYKDELNPANSDNGLCGPETFCKWEKKGVQGICVSNLADNDAMLAANKSLKNEVDAACRNWAVKDLDCDPAGCFGFSFTLDKDFKPDGLGQAARPMPTMFPPWTTQFVRTTTAPDNKSQLKDGIESECYYPKLPPDCTAGAR